MVSFIQTLSEEGEKKPIEHMWLSRTTVLLSFAENI